jgi:shikimate kinase
MKVFLIGYMGVGKTTVGKRLAKALDLAFMDLDAYIEAAERRSISEIFETEGEASFRGIERRSLRELAQMEGVLISCGGGTPCYYDNMRFMRQQGVTVYLQMDASSIVYRLTHAKEKRPLIANKSPEELLTFVKQHLSERQEYYEEAEVRFNALGLSAAKFEDLRMAVISAQAQSR